METGLKLQANGRQSHVDVMEAVCSLEKAAARSKEKLWHTSPIASQLKIPFERHHTVQRCCQ